MDVRIKLDPVAVALAGLVLLLALGGGEAGWPMTASIVVCSVSLLGVSAMRHGKHLHASVEHRALNGRLAVGQPSPPDGPARLGVDDAE